MTKFDPKQLDSLMRQAVKKIGAKKENDICRYIPVTTGGYIHHFTMRKMKNENPSELANLITKHIINVSNPPSVTPKQRAARGSRKRRDHVIFSRDDISRLLHMARLANDREMVRKLLPNKDFKAARRELVNSLKKGLVDHDLWDAYVESATQESEKTTARR